MSEITSLTLTELVKNIKKKSYHQLKLPKHL